MKRNVKNKLAGFAVLVTMMIAVLNSCTKEDNGPDSTGTDRDKFIGSWQGSSTGTLPAQNFNVTITAGSSSPSQILIDNFDNIGSGKKVIADISGNDISITGVPLNIINGDTIDGSGTYNSNNTMTFHYTWRDGQTVDNRTANLHR